MWRKYIFLLFGCILFALSQAKSIKLEYYNSILWSDLQDVKIKGNYAYCLYSQGLLVLDISDPTKPFELGKCFIDGYSDKFEIAGNLAYTSYYKSGLSIIDISDPLKPRFINEYKDLGIYLEYCTQGKLVFIADLNNNLNIVDMSDPERPHVLSNLRLPGKVKAIAADGLNVGLVVDVRRDSKYLPDPVYIIDITDLRHPILSDSIINRQTYTICITDSILYTFSHGYGITLYKIDNSHKIKMLSELYLDHCYCPDNLAIQNGHLLIPMGNDGVLKIIDVFDPCKPIDTHIDCFIPGGGKIDIDNNIAAIISQPFSSGPKIAFYDISNPRELKRLSIYGHETSIFDAEIVGNKAYVVDYNMGMTILDITKSANNKIISEIAVGEGCKQIAIKGDYAYLLNGFDGVYIIDIENSAYPKLSQKIPIPSPYYSASHIDIQGNYLYLGLIPYGLEIFDINNPPNPTLISELKEKKYFDSPLIIGANVYVLDRMTGLYIYELKDFSNLNLLGNYMINHVTSHFTVYGDYAYITDGTDSITVLNISDPANIRLAATPKFEDISKDWGTHHIDDIQIAGNRLFLQGDGYGFPLILDISKSPSLTIDTLVTSTSMTGRLKVIGDKFIAIQSDEINIFKYSE